MPYSLSFSPDFFWSRSSDGVEKLLPSDRPTAVGEALLRLSKETWTRLAREVFGCHPKYLDIGTVLAKIIETDTCSNLDPPVEVWIDSSGEFRVLVFEEPS